MMEPINTAPFYISNFNNLEKARDSLEKCYKLQDLPDTEQEKASAFLDHLVKEEIKLLEIQNA